jgi:integrase/recombinase XerC
MQAPAIPILALDGFTVGHCLRLLRSLVVWAYAMTSRTLAFEPASGRWFAELERAGRSVATIASYRLDLSAIGSAVEDMLGLPPQVESLAMIGQAEIDELDRIWAANGLARSTTLRRFATLRGIAAIASRDVDCSAILAAALPIPSPREMRVASDRDVERMLDLPMTTWTDSRDAAVLTLMSEIGATSIEVAALDRCHWWADAASLALASGSPAARIASLSQAAVEAMADYQRQVPFSSAAASPLFLGRGGGRLEPRTIQVMLSNRSAQAGVSVSVTSMMLRHRRGRQLASDGRSPQQVAEALGISVATAVKYFAPQFDNLRPRKTRGQRGRSARPRRVVAPSEAASDLRSQGGRRCS